MKIALIPPAPSLRRYAPLGDMEMMLAHLLDKPGYRDYYRNAIESGRFVILDNGAHESQREGLDVISMLAMSRSLGGVSEIVLPDVPQNARATIEATARAVKTLTTPSGQAAYAAGGKPNLMYVPQGRTPESWIGCLNQLVKLHLNAAEQVKLRKPTIAIAKYYVQAHPASAHVLYDAIHEAVPYASVDIHILGWPKNLWMLDSLNRYGKFRSCDSARPFVYANAGQLLEPGGDHVPKYPRRDEFYFDRPLSPDQHQLAMRNIAVFRAAADRGLV